MRIRRPRVYLASTLTNAKAVRELGQYFRGCGWEITYDWTAHGGVHEEKQLHAVAESERSGVLAADVVVVLLPGGRGTHTELGIALGAQIPVLLVGDRNRRMNEDNLTCSFYHARGVVRLEVDVLACDLIESAAWGLFR